MQLPYYHRRVADRSAADYLVTEITGVDRADATTWDSGTSSGATCPGGRSVR